jgi:hypothetical protein
MKKLELLEQEESETSGKGKEAAEGDSPTVRHVKERLADTHDALAEISLENERYVQAPTIFQPCLNPNTHTDTPMPLRMVEPRSNISWSCTPRSRRSLLKPTSSFPSLWNLLL